MYRAGNIELFSSNFSKDDKDRVSVNTAALNQRSLLHSRQLMREATLIPCQHGRQVLLPHPTFATGSETRQDAEFRTGEPRSLDDVAPNTIQHILVQEPESMPDTKFLWR